MNAQQWIRADFDGDLMEVSDRGSDLLSNQQSQMRLWRARLINPVAIDGPPMSAEREPIRQDCIEQAQLFLTNEDKGYLVSLHQVEVHDWEHVGTRESLHTNELLGRVKGTLYAKVAPFVAPSREKNNVHKFFKLSNETKSQPTEILNASSSPESATKNNDGQNASKEEKTVEGSADRNPPQIDGTCSGCNFWLMLWVALSVWFVCDWKIAIVSIVPLIIRCLFKLDPYKSPDAAYEWGMSFAIVALAWAMSFYGYRWVQETRCDELYPWWLWIIGLMIVLTRYLRSCIPWLLVVLIWNYSLVLVCRSDGQSCMLEQENGGGYVSSIYDKVTQNIRDKLDRDSNTQIATSQPATDLKGGRISIEQALANTDKYFNCPLGGNGEGPKFNIYFGQGAIFGYADTTISPEARPHLRKLVTLLKRRPNDDIIITGHADKTGSPIGNMKLSEKRAYALADWLVDAQAITAERITVVGAGDLDPLVNLSTDIPLNRRVEVRINCKNRR